MKSSNGEVEVCRSGTVQLKLYHPVTVSLAIRLPIEDGETPVDAVRRVDEICQSEFDEKMIQTINDGFKWGK